MQITLLNQVIAQNGLVLGGINLGPILGIVGGITTVTAQNLNTPVVQTLLNSLSPITVSVGAIATGAALLSVCLCLCHDTCHAPRVHCACFRMLLPDVYVPCSSHASRSACPACCVQILTHFAACHPQSQRLTLPSSTALRQPSSTQARRPSIVFRVCFQFCMDGSLGPCCTVRSSPQVPMHQYEM